MQAGFGFEAAAGIAGYVRALGASHLYLSPIFQAAPGSTHGYDVVDPTRVNEELGGGEGHRALCEALGVAGLGQLVDVVPNHMAITGRENVWWWDVLENGPSSIYVPFFDVEWDPPESKLENKVLLPILGDHYGRELEAGRLRVERDGGSFALRYHDHAAPLAPRSLDGLLEAAAERLPEAGDGAGGSTEELQSIATAFGRLPVSTRTDDESVRERHRDKEILRTRLADACRRESAISEAIDTEVTAVNASADALDALIERQNYRLAWWRVAAEELDYRRFFDINDLAGVRVEDPDVFAATHELVLRWLVDGVVDGLRIDHVDGLADPAGYLARLRAASPDAWLLVEKILAPGEDLPAAWAADGTTGYDWLTTVSGVLLDGAGHERLVAGYRAFTGEERTFADIVYEAKVDVLNGALSAELTRLTAGFANVGERHRRYRDYTRRDLHDALLELLAAFPVYRTYVVPGEPASAADTAVVAAAVVAAGDRRPSLDHELLAFLADVLLLRVPGRSETDLALRFQQLSGPVMAKAVEDTAFYRFVPLVSTNEVGGDPADPAIGVDGFLAACEHLAAAHPSGMLALSTHDTKRSEDVRARLHVLAELPEEWTQTARSWSVLTEHHRADGLLDPIAEWLIYETLVGAWPIDPGRMATYVEKATREAKVHTTWVDPDPAYDEAVVAFVHAILADVAFVAAVSAFAGRIRRHGRTNSLSQKLLTLAGPGVPDLYQGSELWDLSLVDPDNRRPVDYALRRELLSRAEECSPADAWADDEDPGLAKLHVVRAALGVRSAHPAWFADRGAVVDRVGVAGAASDHVVDFRRTGAIAVAQRLPVGLERRGGWAATALALPDGEWRNAFDGATHAGEVDLATLLRSFPVALLTDVGAA